MRPWRRADGPRGCWPRPGGWKDCAAVRAPMWCGLLTGQGPGRRMPRPQGTRADTLDDMTDSDTKDQDRKTTLSLGNRGKLGLAKGGDANQVRQKIGRASCRERVCPYV